jgi:sialic acid synthase SpsE
MKVDIIAEIGINHDGDFDKALRMIIAAKQAGIKIVKFQHYDALKLLGAESPYLAYAASCQFPKELHEMLKQFCDSINMEYLVSVFDINDVAWADKLCKRHKIASRMNTDKAFLSALLMTGKEVIMSIQDNTPVSDLLLKSPQVRFMYCITKYPTPEKDLENISCNKQIGLSSHCPSIQPSLQAISQGATLIEHHVTFSRAEEGCDKPASITFDELAQLNRFANELEVIK